MLQYGNFSLPTMETINLHNMLLKMMCYSSYILTLIKPLIRVI